uniref:Glutamate decarboxylase like 1 n=1 Tax=Oryzias sinensis TaxID=183150 RepID=A0A8C7X667_9TELE
MNGQGPEAGFRHLSKCCPAVRDGPALREPAVEMSAAERFIHEALEVIIDEAVKKATDVQEKVCDWQSPEKLRELLDLELKDGGESDSKILQHCKNAIRYSVKTSHPRFFNQLFAGLEPYSMVASFITEAVKTSLYTYEVAPVFTLMEDAVLKKMMELIGWDEGGDGIFNPGGSMSNMYAVNLARYRFCPDIKEVGLYNAPRLVMFTSQEGHYSISKAAALLGLGTKNVYSILPPADMLLSLMILVQGAVPFFVNATAGTTVFGAFDPVDEIADICERHSLWLHVDACWGGAALVSNQHKHLLKGIHRADSVAWNPHKMLMACLQCSAFLIKDKTSLLQRCHSAKASYLFQQDKFYDVSYDTGDKSVQCSRKPDAFKFWLMWKALGSSELERRVDRALAMARYLAQTVKKREGFHLLMKPEYANVCFWYVPPALREKETDQDSLSSGALVAPVIKERMMKTGSMMIGYQTHGDKPNFFRMVVINPQVSKQDLDFVLDEIHSLGKDLR